MSSESAASSSSGDFPVTSADLTTRRSRRAAKSSRPPQPRHSRQKGRGRLRALLTITATALAVVLVSGAALVSGQALQFTSKLDVVDIDLPASANGQPLPQIGELEGGFNMLVIGVDTREGRNSAFGPDEGAELNDVNLLVHVSEDHGNVTVVSFPRDLIVPIPSCENGKGTTSTMSAQPINIAWSTGGGGKEGGLACVAKTVSKLTGLDVHYAAMTTFFGVIDMSTAVGGVEVCITGGDLYDRYAGLSLSEGLHTLSGWDALAYLRSRHGVGDGSDLGRISSQQAFLSSLLRKVSSDGTLTDFGKLYNLANAAVQNMQLSSSLASPDTMVGLARILSKVDLSKIAFVTYPGSTGSTQYPGKVVPVKSAANELFAALKADKAVIPGRAGIGADVTAKPDGAAGDEATGGDAAGEGEGTAEKPAAESTQLGSGVRGQLASEVSCSVANN